MEPDKETGSDLLRPAPTPPKTPAPKILREEMTKCNHSHRTWDIEELKTKYFWVLNHFKIMNQIKKC